MAQLWTTGRVFLEYVRLLVMPTILQVDVYYERIVGVQHGLSLQAGLGLGLLGLSLVSCLLLIRRARGEARQSTRVLAFALISTFVFLFPVSHIIPFGALMSERLLYAPSFFFVLLVVAVLHSPVESLWRRGQVPRLAVAVTLVVLLALLGLRSFLRSREWHDPVALWTPLLAEVRDDHRIYNNLAVGYVERGAPDRAILMLRRSLELRSDHLPALNNLGYLYLQSGRLDLAHSAFQKVVQRDPRHHLAWNNLGVVESRRERHARARRYFLRALKVNPYYATAASNLRQADRLIAAARQTIERLRPLPDLDQGQRRELARACRAVEKQVCAGLHHAP